MATEAKKPDPGTGEARDAGCTCPVLDNGHGRGYLGMPGVFVYNEVCPVHRPDGLPRRQPAAEPGGQCP